MVEHTEPLTEIHAMLDKLLSSHAAHDVMDLSIATALSVQHEGPLVWLMMIGPPSSGKTETVYPLKSLVKEGKVHFADTLTPASFASGAHSTKGKKAQALLPKLDGKCLVVKDMAALFSKREDTVNDLLGMLTNIYDGEFNVETGTQFSDADVLHFKARFSMLACTTTAAVTHHQRYMAKVGSRFLCYRVPAMSKKQEEDGFDLATQQARETLKGNLAALVREHVLNAPAPDSVTVPVGINEALKLLARFVAKGRTPVRWVRDEDGHWMVTYFEPEAPFRLYQQFRTLLICLARNAGCAEPTVDHLDLVRRVALSTLDTDRSAGLAALRARAQEDDSRLGVTSSDVEATLDVTVQQTRARLRELVDIGLLDSRPVKTGSVGKPATFYSPKLDWEGIILGSWTIPAAYYEIKVPYPLEEEKKGNEGFSFDIPEGE